MKKFYLVFVLAVIVIAMSITACQYNDATNNMMEETQDEFSFSFPTPFDSQEVTQESVPVMIAQPTVTKKVQEDVRTLYFDKPGFVFEAEPEFDVNYYYRSHNDEVCFVSVQHEQDLETAKVLTVTVYEIDESQVQEKIDSLKVSNMQEEIEFAGKTFQKVDASGLIEISSYFYFQDGYLYQFSNVLPNDQTDDKYLQIIETFNVEFI